MTKVAVVLSGCGVFDGAEIHESVLTLLAIERAGASYQCFAPDMEQHHVINHMTGDEMDEKRNVLVESSRIARGDIKPLAEYKADEFDALVLPGGFGAAKNLSSFAFEGADCTVNGDVETALKATRTAAKPIGALCISPAVLAKVFGDVTLTIGQDEGTAQAIEKLGCTHAPTNHGEITVDQAAKVVTTPCYMLDANIAQIAEGAQACVDEVIKLTKA
ncbi:isoprenoid biosynthesis protein with amidotransferase-like domain [Candidatus Terasakiella magnetica]|uniref:Isoprenoid biosynthesis protein with amidotransferase-like domain n=1 Tax=Candidatus Terasakiella magnetica TaxID=1867952 RepID=A0A1C3RGS2_9PROT|nr:isoprenoid biosynthesis glyoxalase ElbB [Candidatus Terasakiella magnetica]SCA56459.1 isoprenoid biosynthesis protein with amidotransferase-like domain [Candidatus Terasakiella magnetica]